MTTASIHSTDTPDAEVIHDLVAALVRDATSLGKDDASRCVRADVKALRAAIEGGAGTVASTLLALDTSVDRLHKLEADRDFAGCLAVCVRRRPAGSSYPLDRLRCCFRNRSNITLT